MKIDETIDKAIKYILNEDNNIKMTITNICKISNISRQTLYNRPDIIKKIKDLQNKKKCSCHLTIEKLTIENLALKKELFKLKTNNFEF